MIVFDLMGTLFKEGHLTKKLQSILEEKDMNFEEEKLRKLYLKYSRGDLPREHFWKEVTRKVEAEFLDSLRLKEGAIEIINHFEKKDLGILSNLPSPWIKPLLKDNSIENNFSTIVISGQCGHRKPETKIYETFLQKADKEAGDCYFIDDKTKNLEEASRMGMVTIWMTEEEDKKPEYNPDYRIEELKELKKIL